VSHPRESALLQLLDRSEIEQALHLYARAVDRSDWGAVRAAYHPDAYDDHGDYRGPVDGLITWLEKRFAAVENGMHFLGNCLVEFCGADLALVETYFVSQRLRPPTAMDGADVGQSDMICRESWGRYVDRFERRDGAWRVAHRTVVLDSAFTFVARGGVRCGPAVWGRRGLGDHLYAARAEIFGGG
jgi:hypothetical protein